MRFILIWQLLVVILFAGHYTLTPQEELWIKNHPTINYVGDPNWLPFEAFDQHNEYVGIVSDLLKLIEKRSNLHFNILHTSSWEESIKLMNSGEAMMISQSKDSNKATPFLFTQSYYKNPIVMVMERESTYVTSLYDIKDKSIAIIKSQAYYNKIQTQYPSIDFINVNSIEEGLERVSTGQSDVFIHTLAQTSYKIAQMQVNNLRIVGRTEFNTRLGFGIAAQNPMLVTILNKIIMSIEPNEAQEILSKWIRQKYVEQANYTPYLLGLSVLLLFLLLVTLYNRRLRHEVTARKKAERELQELNKTLEKRITQEINERKAQDKVLEQQSRSAALGEMMDAVAHQWKQPLNALTMYGDLLNSDFKEGLVTQEYIDEMLGDIYFQIDHMTTTLNEFRTFFRPNQKLKKVNLHECIESVLLLLKDELLKNNITVELKFDKDIHLTIVETEFKHVILNIINNAKDAFNDNNITNRYIKITAMYSDDFIAISLCDNAGGIPKNIIQSIFKPNVTTKAEGKGTGIGLYMSARIIEKSHGYISAYNYSGGACFSIELNRNITFESLNITS